ncbi:MAG: DUF4411 family protein, partial [Candidatus Odinarchaeota archaeon]|nr:DUF4411 family protein [Candidatus Odinarchaeota archaeon]
MESVEQCIYIIDTCSIIDLFRLYPRDIFSKLWMNLDELIKDNRVISHEFVLKELSKKNDEAYKWAKNRKKVFKGVTRHQIKIMGDLSRNVEEFKKLVEGGKDKEIHADPWLIVLALEKEQQRKLIPEIKIKVIVTEEKLKQNKINIPSVCRKLSIECINIIGLMRREKWKW